MILAELPRLHHALDMLGLDIGGNPNPGAVIPASWETRARLADEELLGLNDEELQTFAGGEESEIEEIAKRAPCSHEILNAAFDGGELSYIMSPWCNIFDARDAEQRVAKSSAKLDRRL